MTAHQGSIDSTDTDADSALYDQFSIFVGQNLEYYRAHFLAQQEATGFAFRPNPAAFVLGPIWAAFRRVWRLFWLAVLTDSLGVLLIAMGMVGEELDARDKFLLIVVGLIWLVAGRALIGASANWFLFRQFERWRIDQDCLPGTSRLAVLIGIAWVSLIYPLIAYRMLGHGYIGALDSFPDSRALTHGTASAIDDGVDWMIVAFGTFFEGITIVVRTMLELLESLLIGAPWPIVFALVCALAWRCASFHVMIFTLLSLIYLGLFGYWEKSLSTMALVGTSVVICAVFGLPLGIWSARSSRVNAVLRPILDIMQTLPPFVYLIPAVAFFSIGKPPGVLSTVIFAMPPVVRLTTLGIQNVPAHVREAAVAFGASPRQLLFKVELPLAARSIMAGLNQTVMMSLSMVVVAALIGAGGLGYDVVRALRQIETGKGALAGLAVVLCAMILDRIIQGGKGAKKGIRPPQR